MDDKVLSRWDGLIEIEFGTVLPGYGWVFPKGNHLSIGAMGPLSSARRLRPYYSRLLDSHNLGDYKVATFRGALLPVRRRTMPITAERALLLGDAAGLTDAFTGEGIYYAIRSAQLAAPVITGFLRGDSHHFQDYEKAIDSELMPLLGASRALARISTWVPYVPFRLIKDTDWAWGILCRIIRGEKTYVDYKRKIGPFQFLFDALGR